MMLGSKRRQIRNLEARNAALVMVAKGMMSLADDARSRARAAEQALQTREAEHDRAKGRDDR